MLQTSKTVYLFNTGMVSAPFGNYLGTQAWIDTYIINRSTMNKFPARKFPKTLDTAPKPAI